MHDYSNQTVSVAGGNTEIEYHEHTQSHSQGPEDSSSSGVVLSSITHDHGESKPEGAPQGHQYPVIHTSSSYNYDHVPPMLNGQLTPSENSESQAHGAPQIPGFVVCLICLSVVI